MGSYNYLGFAENNEDFLKTVADKTRQYGVAVCSARQEMGEFVVSVQLYKLKESAAVVLFLLLWARAKNVHLTVQV